MITNATAVIPCPHCHKPFIPTRRDKAFCSRRCSGNNWSKRNKAEARRKRKRKLEADRIKMAKLKAVEPKLCNHCKKMFLGNNRICGTCSQNLEMQQKFVTVDPYRCGGCGSKVIEKPCRACEVRATLAKGVK
jgi:endogenous inhibitor of DNA gyrase (YacG/DUF329 family)